MPHFKPQLLVLHQVLAVLIKYYVHHTQYKQDVFKVLMGYTSGHPHKIQHLLQYFAGLNNAQIYY